MRDGVLGQRTAAGGTRRLAVGLVVSLGLSGLLAACGGSQASSWSASDTASFMASCEGGGVETPSVCSCALTQIQQDQTPDSWRQIVAIYQGSPSLPPELAQALVQCSS